MRMEIDLSIPYLKSTTITITGSLNEWASWIGLPDYETPQEVVEWITEAVRLNSELTE